MAVVYVECSDVSAVVQLIKTITIENGRREAALPAILDPLNLLLLYLSFCGCVDGRHHPHLTRIQVFFTVSKDGVVPTDYRSGIQPTFADFILPDGFTSLRF